MVKEHTTKSTGGESGPWKARMKMNKGQSAFTTG